MKKKPCWILCVFLLELVDPAGRVDEDVLSGEEGV